MVRQIIASLLILLLIGDLGSFSSEDQKQKLQADYLGKVVQIFGLKKFPQYNQELGKIENFDEAVFSPKVQLPVKLINPKFNEDVTPKTILVKLENLKIDTAAKNYFKDPKIIQIFTCHDFEKNVKRIADLQYLAKVQNGLILLDSGHETNFSSNLDDNLSTLILSLLYTKWAKERDLFNGVKSINAVKLNINLLRDLCKIDQPLPKTNMKDNENWRITFEGMQPLWNKYQNSQQKDFVFDYGEDFKKLNEFGNRIWHVESFDPLYAIYEHYFGNNHSYKDDFDLLYNASVIEVNQLQKDDIPSHLKNAWVKITQTMRLKSQANRIIQRLIQGGGGDIPVAIACGGKNFNFVKSIVESTLQNNKIDKEIQIIDWN